MHALLENCVKNYGSEGGRYPQVSHIFFAFDPKKPPGQRIDPRLIQVNDEILDLEKVVFSKVLPSLLIYKLILIENLLISKEYALCTNAFLKSVDDVLKKCPVKVS